MKIRKLIAGAFRKKAGSSSNAKVQRVKAHFRMVSIGKGAKKKK